MSRNNPIFLDIETGGLDPSQSSILTIAAGEQGKVHTNYIRPVGGSFLSSFSEQKILPQLAGKSLTSEKEALESLILQLQKNPAAPLVGYNIRGFDVGFLQRRARIHGLEPLFQRAVGKREIRDPVFQVKDIIAGALSEHADRGTFNAQLGNRTWDLAEADLSPLPFKQRPEEYNLLSQVKGYLKASRETAMFKGWKLEDIHKILETHGAVAPVTGAAHDAAVDLVMTDNVMKAARIGKLGEVFSKPEAALQWMDIVKGRGYHERGAGRLLSQTDIDQMFPTFKSRALSKKGMIGIGIAAAAVAAGIAFSGRDDNYNTIEGLGHGNLAQQGRMRMTPFGSGWDALRNLVKAGETFEKMTGSKSFKTALSQATEVKRLGKGAMGTAMEMKASFRGQEFSFVRKTGDIGTDEASVLRTFQDDFAPSLYGMGKTAEGKHYLDMEMIQGKTARQVMKDTGTLPSHFRQSTTNILDKMHDYGIVHGDPHLSNIMLTPEGKTALIDFGTAGRKGTDFTTLTGKTLSVNHVDTRIMEMDRRVLEASIAKNRPTAPPPPPKAVSAEGETAAALRSQKTAIGNKRRRQADLQRSAVAQSWSNATVAGRKSRT